MRATEVCQLMKPTKKCQLRNQEVCQLMQEIKKRLANQAKKQERSVNQGDRGQQIKNSNRSANLANKREEEVG